MLDLSSINNEKLRNLIAASAKFSALPENKQIAHVERVKDLSPDRQERLCKFFAEENTKEKKLASLTSEEKLIILERLFNELVDLENKFSRLLRQETEVKDRENEGHQMDQLINQLNKN